jgi:collagenase-like PrtC family protease
LKLALGPILYFWPRATVLAFYRRLADAPVDVVYLGEVVCSKRRALRLEDWLGIAEYLRRAGKEVVLSTLALVEAESELGLMRRIAGNGRFRVEANDMAAVNMLAGHAAFVAGPHLNTYNHETLALLHSTGARRWVMPVELNRYALAAIQQKRPADMETEVFAFGRLPLAFSARCFTARAHNLGKDECGFRCAEDPDGMLLSTREQQAFLALNGVQTQSAQTYNLLPHLAGLEALNVDVVRLSPQAQGTFEIIEVFRAALAGRLDAEESEVRLRPYLPYGVSDGYWFGQAGMARSQPVEV